MGGRGVLVDRDSGEKEEGGGGERNEVFSAGVALSGQGRGLALSGQG